MPRLSTLGHILLSKTTLLAAVFLLIVPANAFSQTIISCTGNTRTLFPWDGTNSNEQETRTYKVENDSIDTQKCSVSTDAKMQCSDHINTSQKTRSESGMTSIAFTTSLNRYSGVIEETITQTIDKRWLMAHYPHPNSQIAPYPYPGDPIRMRIFKGNCTKAKKMF